MRASECIGCEMFPCRDVNHDSYVVPEIDLDPGKISMAMISEAASNNPQDYYYAKGDPPISRRQFKPSKTRVQKHRQ